MIARTTEPGPISLDRFVGHELPVQTRWLEVGADGLGEPPREPHRHDYHELIVQRTGSSRHLLDGTELQLDAGSALLLARGRVHAMLDAQPGRLFVVRFGEELLTDAARQTSPGWLLAGTPTCTMRPPEPELDRCEQLARLLEAELLRPADASTATLVGYLVSALLLHVRRWRRDAAMETPPSTPDADTAMLDGFARLLEAEYAAHHDAAWYAGQLAISPSHLATTLTRTTGRSTKKLITDRLMTEAARLLRFTDLTVQQVAQRLGYDDPFHLSRAFKAYTGVSPAHYRAQR